MRNSNIPNDDDRIIILLLALAVLIAANVIILASRIEELAASRSQTVLRKFSWWRCIATFEVKVQVQRNKMGHCCFSKVVPRSSSSTGKKIVLVWYYERRTVKVESKLLLYLLLRWKLCALDDLLYTLQYCAICLLYICYLPWVENASSLSVSWSYLHASSLSVSWSYTDGAETTGAGTGCGNDDAPDA